MTYCWKCLNCGFRLERNVQVPLGADPCPACGVDTLRRDYQAEAAGIGSGVRVSRDGTNLERARLFLPSNQDLATKDDPEGKKGAADWLERFQPATSKTSNPLLEPERTQF